jgi:hypothetical protein
MIKYLKVNIKGCLPIKRETSKERICKLSGHALKDEDISYLAYIKFPLPEYVLRHVAVYIDTTWRPRLQKFVVENVAQHTGWPIQIFHGSQNGNQMKQLFDDRIYFTDLQTNDMSWFRLSSLMLLTTFWRACIGKHVLVFQPESPCEAENKRSPRTTTQGCTNKR